MNLNNFLKLIVAIAISELAGVIGAVFTVSAIPSWYEALAKPELAPPNWVFGPAWTTLYLLMGISALLVWRKGFGLKNVQTALILFGVQLVLNTFWSIIFFGLRAPGAAFVTIILLWVTIFATIIAFSKISRPAAWLLVPYILWVSFAAYLNYSIWVMN